MIVYQAARNVFEADQKVISLVQMMVNTFSFVEDTQTLREKATSLHQSINGLLKQTVECCLFVRQYVQRSFLGEFLDQKPGSRLTPSKNECLILVVARR